MYICMYVSMYMHRDGVGSVGRDVDIGVHDTSASLYPVHECFEGMGGRVCFPFHHCNFCYISTYYTVIRLEIPIIFMLNLHVLFLFFCVLCMNSMCMVTG